ncbi:xanthine dehydrogenase family protein molybdopterin-binding subunit [Crenobacter sp. SG2305]|uniref:xanthine dehydrogenase family protein molybdopterin-binding subunit n=1 Tax=Crenobacter oryzisoli TaxID=3056844 RepID=UPI0025AAFC2F|nr:xanthine dehydrogenase family protein molybdopterin-binding subunit [Crenobacter sp. SG2305]MDN0085236.1 xanthine dehydrogenase family protein molybdopterin-binding subunit [Crenobacter sp. SG2305]
MTSSRIENASRRRFLQSAVGLTLAIYLPAAKATSAGATSTASATGASANTAHAAFEPNAFLRIGEDNSVTVISKHLEMGQGTYTGLATIVAEELDADWEQVRVESAPADAKRYNNLFWGTYQGTGGSTAIANSWEQLRKAGATARAMLVAAAAKQWNVPAGEISVSNGEVRHTASGSKASFGQLARAAAELTPPTGGALKDPKDFKLIGQRIPRKDNTDKSTGKAVYTQDIHLPGMLTAVVAHPPRFGAKLKSFNAAKAKAVKGVVAVLAIPTGVAVLAKDTWSAKKGRDVLLIEWDESQAFKLGSEQILARYRELAGQPGAVARKTGDAEQALASAAHTLEASYDFPYLAHAAMEPMNCVVHWRKDGCEVWNGNQMQTADQMVLAKLFGLAPEQVRIHTLYAGGSFGRRASKDSDYILEAAHIAKAYNGRAPVKLVWLREDDMRAGYYRPMFHHRLRAGLDKQGRLVGWQYRLVGQSILADSPFEAMLKDGIDPVSVEGAANLPYAVPNLLVDLHTPTDIGIPVLWWRSVGSTHTAFSTETFLDELAQTAGHDPVAWRLAMLAEHPRHAAVLKLVADKAGWGAPLAPGKSGERRGRGVALHESFGTVVAEVAEVTVQPDGNYRVDRVVCAVDCGIAVNPDVVRAQVEGAVGFALAPVLYGAITLTDGKVDQSNFHDYPPIRMADMPRVEVHIVPSGAKPSGIGEPGVPPLAPAVANALAAATGKRARKLPISAELLKV